MIRMERREAHIDDWISYGVKRGIYTFSRQKLVAQFSHLVCRDGLRGEIRLAWQTVDIYGYGYRSNVTSIKNGSN